MLLSSSKSQHVGCFPSVGLKSEGIQNQAGIVQVHDVSCHDVEHLQFVLVEGVERQDFGALTATEMIVQYTHTEKFQSVLFKMLLFDGLVKVLEIAVAHDVASVWRTVMRRPTLLQFQFGTSDSMRVGCIQQASSVSCPCTYRKDEDSL